MIQVSLFVYCQEVNLQRARSDIQERGGEATVEVLSLVHEMSDSQGKYKSIGSVPALTARLIPIQSLSVSTLLTSVLRHFTTATCS